MKIKLDIDDELLAKDEAMAEREGTTLDALVERGLSIVCAEGRTRPAADRRSGAEPN